MRNLVLASLFALSLTACGEDPAAPNCTSPLTNVYEGANTSLELVLDQDCSTGSVTGILYDADSFRYDLTGSVSGAGFTFSATRDRPSGGVDTYRSQGPMEVLSGGQILRGKITKNGIGPNELLRFVRVAE